MKARPFQLPRFREMGKYSTWIVIMITLILMAVTVGIYQRHLDRLDQQLEKVKHEETG